MQTHTLQASCNSAILSLIVRQGLKLKLQKLVPHQKTAVLEPTMDSPMQILVVVFLSFLFVETFLWIHKVTLIAFS